MTSSMHKILIVGGTSGIGEEFARRFHNMGKKVIVTGRRKDRLSELQNSLTGLETYTFDMTDLSAIPSHVDKLFSTYPSIDTVWINGGIQVKSDIKDLSSTTDAKVISELTTNITAPILLSRHVVPKLLAQKKETQLMITGSGIGFVPTGVFPVYSPTKAAIHSYLVAIRQALKDTQVNVLELVPPFVDTDLVNDFRAGMDTSAAMTLKDYTDESFKVMEQPAKDLKEIAAGSAVPRVDAWRGSIGKILVERGVGG